MLLLKCVQIKYGYPGVLGSCSTVKGGKGFENENEASRGHFTPSNIYISPRHSRWTTGPRGI
jgi:hypothetical protein